MIEELLLKQYKIIIFIINKWEKTPINYKLFEINENIDSWNNICSNYENDTYDFISSTEIFDNIMPFKTHQIFKKFMVKLFSFYNKKMLLKI